MVIDHRPPGAGAEPERLELVATRGRRLALFGDEHSRVLIQADADGRVWRTELYAVADDAAAREQLALLGGFDDMHVAVLAALDADDFEGPVGLWLAEDCVHVYHPAGLRAVGREAIADYLRTARWRGRCEIDRVAIVAPGVGTHRERWTGHDRRTDADWEHVLQVVFTYGDALRMTRIEAFLAGDSRFDEAVARLATRNAPSSTTVSPSNTSASTTASR